MSAPARVGGVAISNPVKLWWPDEGITKADVARFYAEQWSRIKPWMADRPLTAERCPDGMAGECFFQKDFKPGALPLGAPRLVLRASSTGRDVHYLVGGSRATLLGMVNLGCIAIHVMNSRASAPQVVDWLAFDIDPPERFADAARAALELRKVLDAVSLRSYPKTSGGRGLHVLVPLKRRYGQRAVRAGAIAIGEELARRAPRLVTTAFAKSERRGRVFADPFRNGIGQTIVSPYSVRRRPRAPVSTPLAWDEVNAKMDPARFNMRTIEKRLAGKDPWADFWRDRQALKSDITGA